MMEKVCSACKKTKPTSEYTRRTLSADGLMSECRECTYQRNKKYREANRDKIAAAREKKPSGYNREYYLKNRERCLGHGKKWRRNNPDKGKEYYQARKHKLEYKKKSAIRSLVKRAIKAGKIIRKPCEKCGSDKWVHGHHDDYSKPLEVRWLCPIHHHEVHKEADFE